MFLLWLIHLYTRNASIVDPGWAAGLALCAFVYAALGDGYEPRRWLVAAMAGVWGLRLAAYLLFTRVIGHPEEGRYVHLRKKWKTSLAVKFLIFFQAQALLDVILSVPFLLAARNPRPQFHPLEWAALAVWAVSIAGESLADAQLHRFKSDPANQGKVCQTGLWNYSRHPNYFFEWLVWVAFALLALPAPWGWTAIYAPLLMLGFLFKVTGIPATEAQAVRSKGQAYREYQRTTNVFIPWFKRMDSLNP
jgi:steroid 5-alpha reductase family enzyme